MTPAYEVYAIEYAHHERAAGQNFLGGDPHDGSMPMDYFVWLVRGAGLELVVDTGFNAATAARRQRQLLRPVDRALADSTEHIIPGHDPAVLERYPAPSGDLQGVVGRLD